MNKFIFILFVVVLVSSLGLGFYYLSQTQNSSFLNLFSSSPISTEKTIQSVSSNCKDTGFSTQELAKSYLEALFVKVGYTEEKQKEQNYFTSVIPLGNNCWGVWIGEAREAKTGILYWEDSQGNLKQRKTTIEL